MARAATGSIPPATSASSSGPTTTPIRPRERRRGNRQPLGVLGVLTQQNNDNRLEVSVLNVSLHGCAFRAPVGFAPGALYSMKIGTGPLHLTSTLRIISSRERSDGSHDVGAKFV